MKGGREGGREGERERGREEENFSSIFRCGILLQVHISLSDIT